MYYTHTHTHTQSVSINRARLKFVGFKFKVLHRRTIYTRWFMESSLRRPKLYVVSWSTSVPNVTCLVCIKLKDNTSSWSPSYYITLGNQSYLKCNLFFRDQFYLSSPITSVISSPVPPVRVPTMFVLLLKKIQMTVLGCPLNCIFILWNIVKISQFIENLQWGYTQIHLQSARAYRKHTLSNLVRKVDN